MSFRIPSCQWWSSGQTISWQTNGKGTSDTSNAHLLEILQGFLASRVAFFELRLKYFLIGITVRSCLLLGLGPRRRRFLVHQEVLGMVERPIFGSIQENNHQFPPPRQFRVILPTCKKIFSLRSRMWSILLRVINMDEHMGSGNEHGQQQQQRSTHGKRKRVTSSFKRVTSSSLTGSDFMGCWFVTLQ
jgi:hypothetical protein